ncbi:MAG: amidinotransferase [Bacteroidetes bacterium]|jgi:N-dimethylarginine dimethylaminohydrolase|nr:amidinotransferase [Bacteroidota bacterium]
MLYTTASALDFQHQDLPALPPPSKVLLTTPDHFDVQYVINPHMEGHIDDIDRTRARQQWEALRAAYARLDLDIAVMDGAAGLPDMVFCANQTLPSIDPDTGEKDVILSRMHAPERRPEVAHYAAFFEAAGYTVHALYDDTHTFEGMGDALWHAGRRLLWGGYGFRTDAAAYEPISDTLDVPVVLLRLDDPDFYHLDTCLSVLDETTALIYPGAFDDEGLRMLSALFDTLIEANDPEARDLFAVNAHCPDGQHVLIQEGCTHTAEALHNAGFTPVPLDTSEFLKAGGSVFCMKLMYW